MQPDDREFDGGITEADVRRLQNRVERTLDYCPEVPADKVDSVDLDIEAVSCVVRFWTKDCDTARVPWICNHQVGLIQAVLVGAGSILAIIGGFAVLSAGFAAGVGGAGAGGAGALAAAGGGTAAGVSSATVIASGALEIVLGSGIIVTVAGIDAWLALNAKGSTGQGEAPKSGRSEPSDWPNFNDPGESPGPGWEWRGQPPAGGDKGSWYNPTTRESLHPDLNHGSPIGPHYDWTNSLKERYRVFADGTITPK